MLHYKYLLVLGAHKKFGTLTTKNRGRSYGLEHPTDMQLFTIVHYFAYSVQVIIKLNWMYSVQK